MYSRQFVEVAGTKEEGRTAKFMTQECKDKNDIILPLSSLINASKITRAQTCKIIARKTLEF